MVKMTSMSQTQTRINLKDRKKLLNLYLLKRTKTFTLYKNKDLRDLQELAERRGFKDLKANKDLKGLKDLAEHKGIKDLVDQ
jgi:hypothetical protein